MMMIERVSWLLLASVAAACGPSAPPTPAEGPAQPLVIGTSPKAPIAVLPEEPLHEAAVATGTTLAIPARDPRLARAPRARALVVTELTQLEQLFKVTTVSAPDHPAIGRRLAEDYAELARAATGETSATASKQSLKYYEIVINDSPQYPLIDEVLYYAGLAHELAGNTREARKLYFEVIKRSPQSKFIPFAYFGFAEMFFAEGATDPIKNQLAEQAYLEVIKYPPPTNALYNDAKARLAELATRVTRP